MHFKKPVLFILVLVLLGVMIGTGLPHVMSLETLKLQADMLTDYRSHHPWLSAAWFFALYTAMTGLSLPGAVVMTVAGGALFGLIHGTALVSLASTLGATGAFLVSRHLLRDVVLQHFGARLAAVNEGMERDGPYYLFALRLVPVIPFFLINLLMGLTTMRTWTFAWVSQLGMLLGTVVYVNAGTQLASVQSLADVLSLGVIASFVALGLLPLAARTAQRQMERHRLYARWRRPPRFERNLVVIGAGSAGLVTAYIASAVRAKVTLVERHAMGGDCLNTGCVPSKALIRSAKLLHQATKAHELGIAKMSSVWDFGAVMERVQQVIVRIAPHDSVERYSALGVECVYGSARLVTPWEVEITHPDQPPRRLSTRNIVIATGARPFIPPIPGLAEIGPLTSDTVWELRKLPRRLVVLGGGPIGTELTQCFARLGASVTQVEAGARLLAREDAEVSDFVKHRLEEEGVRVLTEHRALAVVTEDADKFLLVEHGGRELRLPFDEILCATGRIPNTDGLGLEDLGIAIERVVETNTFMETSLPNIYACGDVAGPYQFTHTAAHGAWYATVNALFGGLRRFAVDYSVVPWTTFTDPEVARVGLNEAEATTQGIAVDVYRYDLDDLDRAIADGAAHGFVKVLTKVGSDKILGATIVGEHAAELLIEFVAAMKHGFGLNAILTTIHTYPTFSEANKFVAGAYKRTTATAPKLALAAAYHDWTRGEGSLATVLKRCWALVFAPRRAYTAARTVP